MTPVFMFLSSITMKIIGTVFQHKDVEYRFQNDTYSVWATQDIPVGTLILLEHVLWGSEKQLIRGLSKDKIVARELYPRTPNATIQEKCSTNAFGFFDHLVLGNKFSKFNHSCQPNCYMGLADRFKNEQTYGMWTVQNIKAGTELCIDYVTIGDVEYHKKMKEKHGFQCSCTDEYIRLNEKRSEIRCQMGSTFREKETAFIQITIDHYMASPIGREVVKNIRAIHANKH